MRPLLAAGALATFVLPAQARVPAPPPRERVVNTYPTLPAEVTRVEGPIFSHDGALVVASAQATGFSASQIVSFRKDGSGFRCLTCASWSGAALTKPYTFNDGRRILVRIGRQTPLSSAAHGVVECAPSVADCERASVVPIEAPSAGDASVVQDQRELRIAPDSRHVAFTQVRTSPGGRQTGVAIFGRLVRRAGSYAVTGARVVAVGGELKSFTPDGRGIYFTRFGDAFDANNPDNVLVSLRTGRETRATTAPDWDEDIAQSPARHRGRGWIVAGSSRGTGQLETLGRLRRPVAIEYGTLAINFSIFVRPESSEPWLADEHDARGRYIGQALAPRAVARGWDSRPTYRWSPKGNEILFWQARIGGTGTRVVLSRLRDRRPVRPRRPRTSPTPRWAPPLAGYVPPNPARPRSRRGRRSGRMTVTLARSPDPEWTSRIVVRYRNFSDVRGLVLNGREVSDYDPADGPYGTPCLYSADVRVSGRHRGYLRASKVRVGGQGLGGPIRSSLDGRRLRLGPPLGAAAAAPWSPDTRAASAWAAGRAGQVSFSVRTEHRAWGRDAARAVPAASVLKAMLLVAYLREHDRPLTAADRALLAPMIRWSDNVAATRVRDRVGDDGLVRLARRAGMRHFRPAPVWGLSSVDAADQSRFLLHVDRLVPRRHRRYALRLLGSVVRSQRWGIARVRPPGWALYFKGGWGSGSGAVDHQVALLRRGDRRVAVAIMTTSSPSHAYAKATLEGVARRLLRGLRPGSVPAGSAAH